MKRSLTIPGLVLLLFCSLVPRSIEAHPNSFDSNIDLNIRITETAIIFDLDIATFLFPPLEDVKFGLVAPKPTAPERAERMEAYLAEKCSVHVDGVLVKPKLTELVFDENPQGMHLNKPRPIIYALTSFSYPLKTKPREIKMRWGIFLDIPDSFYQTLTEPELFGEDLSELNPQLDAYGNWEVAYFAPIEPEFIWHSPDYRAAPPPSLKAVSGGAGGGSGSAAGWTLPLLSLGISLALLLFLLVAFARRMKVAIVIPVILFGGAGAFLAKGIFPVRIQSLVEDSSIVMPDEAGAVELFKTLHGNIYRAFDYKKESDVYDALAQSVDGELLESVYNEVYQNLIMRDQGGAVAKVSKVDVLECEAEKISGGEEADSLRFEVDCHWRVHGMVTHNGHSHRRINEYRATYEMAPRGGAWKITGSKVGEQKRVFTRELQQKLEAAKKKAAGNGSIAQEGAGGDDTTTPKNAEDANKDPNKDPNKNPNKNPNKEPDKDAETISSQDIRALFLKRLGKVFLAFNGRGPKAREAALAPLVEDSLLTHVSNELLERIRAEEEDEKECVFLSTRPPAVESCRVYEVTREGETRFQIVCKWKISGTVEVEGKTRAALHSFAANFELAYRQGKWKITDLQIDSHERLDPPKKISSPPTPAAAADSDARNQDDSKSPDSNPRP